MLCMPTKCEFDEQKTCIDYDSRCKTIRWHFKYVLTLLTPFILTLLCGVTIKQLTKRCGKSEEISRFVFDHCLSSF